MGKQVKVKLIQKGNEASINGALVDMTVGNIYSAYIPSLNERDKDGMRVAFEDELWIKNDDAGDEVVTRIGKSFEVVE